MNKNSLANIMYEKSIERQSSKNNIFSKNTHLNIFSQTDPENKDVFSNRSNQLLKITQFNTSLILDDDINTKKRQRNNYSSSPQKVFNTKKVKYTKPGPILHVKHLDELQFRRKTNRIVIVNKDAKRQIEKKKKIEGLKLLISNNWNNKYQNPMNQVYESINGTVVIVKPSQKPDSQLYAEQYEQEQFSNIILGKSKQIIISNDVVKISSLKDRHHERINHMPSINNDHQKDLLKQKNIRKYSASPHKNYSRYIMQQKKYQENIQKQKRQILELKKELNKNYNKPFNPPQNISAFSYIVYEADIKKSKLLRKCSAKRQQIQEMVQVKKIFLHSHQVIASLNSRTAVQIASLTKMMTCIIALEIGHRFKIKLQQQSVKIGLFQQNIGGTSANIRKGQIYSVQQLLYGLMLPSGNDASIALAVWSGKILGQKEPLQKGQQIGSPGLNEGLKGKKRQHYQRFVHEMNKKAFQLNMQKTKFVNSHGLSNPENKSCAFDLAILCEYCMNNPQFRRIVSCKNYEAQIQLQSELNTRQSRQMLRQSKRFIKKTPIHRLNKQFNSQFQEMKDTDEFLEDKLYEEEDIITEEEKEISYRIVKWENTHPLLQEKSDLYVGIKTGITNTAGPCLASCISIRGRRFIIIVLNCKNIKYRVKDSQALRKWLFNKELIKYIEQIAPQQQRQRQTVL